MAKWEKDNEYLLLTVTRGRQVQVWWWEGLIILQSNVLHTMFRILSFVGPLCKWWSSEELFAVLLHFNLNCTLEWAHLFFCRNVCSPEMFHNPESVRDNLIRLQVFLRPYRWPPQTWKHQFHLTSSDMIVSPSPWALRCNFSQWNQIRGQSHSIIWMQDPHGTVQRNSETNARYLEKLYWWLLLCRSSCMHIQWQGESLSTTRT